MKDRAEHFPGEGRDRGIPVSRQQMSSAPKMSIGLNLLLIICRAASFAIYFTTRFVLRYRREILEENFKNAFPDKSKAERKALIKVYYKHLGDLVVEPVLFSIVNANVKKRLATYQNKELLSKLYAENKHVILLASHHGNWEYLINLPREVDFKVYTAYTAISNAHVDSWVHKMRSKMGVEVIVKKNFYKTALSALRSPDQPALVVVIADQRPAPGSTKYSVEFLHQTTSVQIGAERLALASNAVVLYLQCEKVARFHYQYTFHLITENPAAAEPLSITKAYYEKIEQDIQADPGYWLWTHKRWKPVASLSKADPVVA
ncbi:Lipid A biosynthesis lauroyltransferase [Dyadobacter sp. CECT 9623]|uniref:Lipid A biosynthesis lauroyltransferase n=1 Tax=Dyadobacter linearis TaxID=2823330 RepID=A0ABM8UW60_9BACT|nr:lysophospholipid acyltransferase family protein [Dyadobacter sp. CECT 9623]CAG5072990.1 Lipid A biosynthesis lauroyltransferase [Dyadobacter sp. CECT 9623]